MDGQLKTYLNKQIEIAKDRITAFQYDIDRLEIDIVSRQSRLKLTRDQITILRKNIETIERNLEKDLK